MTLKEKFLGLKSEEEMRRRIHEFKVLVYDADVKRHINKPIPPIGNYTDKELVRD